VGFYLSSVSSPHGARPNPIQRARVQNVVAQKLVSGYLILSHELATGADCVGCLTVVERGDMVEIKCDSCGAVVDTVPSDRGGSRLMELGSAEVCSARCPHCGATNVFRGFTVIEAFVCQECGEGVDVEQPVQ